VDGDEREPVAAIHAVAREVDPQRGLRQLRGHLLRRQRHLPGLVRVPVQAEVLLLWIALRVEVLDVVGEGPEDGGAAGAVVLEDVLGGAGRVDNVAAAGGGIPHGGRGAAARLLS